MSALPWNNALTHSLSRLQQPDHPIRVALVGIGQELRGDDAAGVLVARLLEQTLKVSETFRVLRDSLLVIDAGPAPENCTGLLRRFQPNLVLLVDAAQLDELPGAVRWLDWQETTGLSASTHTLPPYMLAEYLVLELNCEVALLGLQPGDTTAGAPLSPSVQAAVEEVVRQLTEILIITLS
jgi:hydrogenase 3 maturation protease